VIGSLLADSLTLWKLRGSVTEDVDGVVIRVEGSPTLRVVSGQPVRWSVRVEGGPPRYCTSIVGLLSAVREELGVSGGPALRIAPARSEA
jgi:hypothetical protein